MITKSVVYRWPAVAFIFCLIVFSALRQADRVEAVANPLDVSFGAGGKVITNILSYKTVAADVAIQPDGKIVVVGYTYDTSPAPTFFSVVRYDPNGSLDTTFGGGDGIVTGQFRDSASYLSSDAASVAIQPDGKILVGGSCYQYPSPRTDFAAARLNPNGSFDNTFDGDGRMTIAIGPEHDILKEITIQPDGKIILSGNTREGVDDYPALVRLNPNGSPDTGFSADGVITNVHDIFGSLTALLVLPDGKISGIVSVWGYGSNDIMLIRYNGDGSPDTTFDGDGRRLTKFIGHSGGANAAALLPDGKMILAGGINISSFESHLALMRVNPDGTIDTSFGGGGLVTTSLGGNRDSLLDVAIQPDGKIVAAGGVFLTVNNSSDFALLRFNADGSLDTTFDLDGKILTSFAGGSTQDNVSAMALQPNGKAVVVGITGRQAAMTRYMGDIHTADFDGDSRSDISIWRPSGGAWYSLPSSSSGGFSAVSWGLSSDKPAPGDYTGDGITDAAVFRPADGGWYILRSENSSFTFVGFGLSGDIPVPADFDGDGLTDVAVFRPSNGAWFSMDSSNGNVRGKLFGQSGDIPIPGDYDGGGSADLTIFRPSTATWYRFNAADGQFFITQFGAGGDQPVSGDFDGDSKTDIAIFRPSNGVWYSINSSNGNVQAIQWGQNGDIPAPADYDGDGRSEPAVFRQGTWYVLRNGNASITNFGLAGDVPVPSAITSQ